MSAERLDWADRSACIGHDDLFLGGHQCWNCPTPCPEADGRKQANRERTELCKAICRECPVLFQCRKWVLALPLPVYGVVGGMTEDERRRKGWGHGPSQEAQEHAAVH